MDPIELVDRHKVNRFFRARKKLTQGNLISHVTQRSAGREPCFIEDDDYLCMLGFLKESTQKYDYQVFAFCLMQNHVHFLLRPNNDNLQLAMRDLFSRYAMRFNRKYERRGHLFGGPYRQAVCLEEAYLLTASVYIHLNPVKAEIVDDPEDYRWSSVRLYIDEAEKISFINAGVILRLLDEKMPVARERYLTLLQKGSGLPLDYALSQEQGVEAFKKKLVTALPKIFDRLAARKTVARIRGKEILNMEALERQIDETVVHYGKRKPGSRQAMKFVIEQMIARGFKQSEVAERLNVSHKTVYNLLKMRF